MSAKEKRMNWNYCWNKWIKGRPLRDMDFRRFFKCLSSSPPPPRPPEPPEPPEPPYVMPVCDHPYNDTGKIICYSGGLLTILCARDGPGFKEDDLPKYFDWLVDHGANSFRSLSGFFDESVNWKSFIPGRDSDYFDHLHRRLKWAVKRKLTPILTLKPYQGNYPQAIFDRLITETKQYLPYLIYEAANEPQTNEEQQIIIRRLVELGAPAIHIQQYYIDSGEWFDDYKTLAGGGKSPATSHEVGSMSTIFDEEKGWAKGPGSGVHTLMSMGYYGSNDGEDVFHSSLGLTWPWLPAGQGRRPNVAQIYGITKWMLENTMGYEHLTASGFQGQSKEQELAYPDLNKEMELGGLEVDAMYQAYKATR